MKGLSDVGGNPQLAAALNTDDETITYESSWLTLPAYSIAVLTLE